MSNWLDATTKELAYGLLAMVLVLICVALIAYGFYYFVKKSKLEIDELTESMPNIKSEIIIDVKEKQVYKKLISSTETNTKIENMKLDDFIYMLSLNPESKSFRELLKLVDNGATKTQLNRKFKSIEFNKLMVTLRYTDTRASVAIIDLDQDNKTVDEYIKFQLSESFFLFKKKETFMNILEDPIEYSNDHNLFQLISKDVKAVKTKGWTVVKIQNNKEMLSTTKDYETNTIQMIKLIHLLKIEGYNAHLSEDGYIFFVTPSGRNSNHFSIYRNWTSKLQSILSNNKYYYFDITSDEISITTANDFVKDSRAVNTTLMNLEILSTLSSSDKLSKKVVDSVFERTAKIHAEGAKLIKSLKEGPFPLMSTEYSIKQTSPKAVVEYYLDLPASTIADIIKYSFQHKKDLMQLTYKEAVKRSKGDTNKLNTIMFDVRDLTILSRCLPVADPKIPFYISFAEDETNWHTEKLNEEFRTLRDNGHKLVQLVRELEDGSTKLHLAMKPTYILLTRDFTKVDDPNESININLAKLNTVKEKQVKILNIK